MYGEFGGMYVDDMLKERLKELENSSFSLEQRVSGDTLFMGNNE